MINFSPKYKNLFDLIEGKHEEVDIVIITGGRGSGKSFALAVFVVRAVLIKAWKAIYTRFTNTSIGDSIKAEVQGAINIVDKKGWLREYNKVITSPKGKTKISYKGLKPGSKNQSANLKSISGFNLWVLDEAEECPDFETFQKIYLSIRSKEERNLSVMVLNPTYKQHWIYREFFLNRGLEGGYNGINGNVLYIHTSHVDLPDRALPDSIVRYYERLKVKDHKKYNNIVLGGWLDSPDGVLLPMASLRFDNKPTGAFIKRIAFIDPAEGVGGTGDMISCIFLELLEVEGELMVHVLDVVHTNEGIEHVAGRIHDKARKWKMSEVAFEKNGVGLAAGITLKNLNIDNGYRLIPFHSKINKDIRIGANYEFVKSNYIFKSDYNASEEYSLFMHHLTIFSTSEKNTGRRDAIDVCCTSARLLKLAYPALI